MQLAELAAIGLDWDGPVVRQQERFDRYARCDRHPRRGRPDVRVLLQPPRDPRGGRRAARRRRSPIPGTCRELTAAERAARREVRPPAVRLRAPGDPITVEDLVRGPFTGVPDDVVLRRNDGVPAYNLAVVVDDAAQGDRPGRAGATTCWRRRPARPSCSDLLGLPRRQLRPRPAGGRRRRRAAGQAPRRGHARGPRAESTPGRVVAALARSLGVPIETSAATAADALTVFDRRRPARPRPGAGAARRPATILVVSADVDDLARVLGYQGAVDERGGISELGPDLLVVPFWTPPFCAAVVRAAELVGFDSDPDDPVPGHEVSLATISPRLYEAVQDDLGRRIWPQLQEVWPLIDYHGLRDAFVIRYAMGEQESLRVHHDVAQVSALGEARRRPRRRRAALPTPGRRQRRRCRSGRCWPGRRSSPTPTRRRPCGAV